jgi:glycosyltransferase involved in cell wall biosynthesis
VNKKILLLGDINSSHLRKWAEGISSGGNKVGIFSLSMPEYNWHSSHGIKLFDYGFINDKNTFLKNDFFKMKYFSRSGEVRKCIDEFKPDILHAHYASSYGMLAMRSRIHPFVLSVWGSDVFDFPRRSFIHRYILRSVFRNADKILSTSKIMKEEISKYTNKDITVTPFGIDTDIFMPENKNHSGVFRIGIVKSLEIHYGIDFLIKAFKIVFDKYPDRKLELVIAGSGSREAFLRNLVSDLNLNDSVKFKGRVRQEDVPDLINTFDLFVCPSIHESFGVSVLEASACGVPVIVSNAGGLKEVAKAGETGLFVPPGNEFEIANAISYFISNPSAISEFGVRGRAFVLENYNWKNNRISMEGIYESLFNNV